MFPQLMRQDWLEYITEAYLNALDSGFSGSMVEYIQQNRDTYYSYASQDEDVNIGSLFLLEDQWTLAVSIYDDYTVFGMPTEEAEDVLPFAIEDAPF